MAGNMHPLFKYIYDHFRINFIIIGTISLTIFVVIFFFVPKEYTAKVSILPSAANFSQGIMKNLGSLGKFAGFDLSTSSGRSQEMYDGIIKSNRLIDEIVAKEYTFLDEEDSITIDLVSYFDLDADSPREMKEMSHEKMREDVIFINIDAENDILYMEITTENPFLSAILANEIVVVLNQIVKNEVQKEFHQKLSFLKRRLGEIQDSLRIAENDLKMFLENNTDPTIPAFQIQQLRMRRNLRLQTELLVEFRTQLEIFMADNMINLADIKVLDDAYAPYRKSRPKRALMIIAFAILAGFMQLGVIVSILYYKKVKQELNRNTVAKT